MKIYSIILIILVCISSCSISGKKVKRLSNAINTCVQTYSISTNKKVPNSVDRIYIDEFVDSSLTLYFYKGENGSFGAKDANSISFMACSLLSNGKIFFLARTMKDSLIDINVDLIDYSDDKNVVEYLFILKDGKYLFSKSQMFSTSLENMNR